MTDEEKLKNYEKEIYGDFLPIHPLTVDMLIDWHRRLRALNIESQAQFRAQVAEGYEFGKKQAFEAVTSGEYISKEALRNMSVGEMADFLVGFMRD